MFEFRVSKEKFLGYPKVKRKNGSYNKTKKRALEALEDRIPIDGATFARKVGIRPIRLVYAYLALLQLLV